MCGLAGWVGLGNVVSRMQRLRLACALGVYNDARGGHACGYVGLYGYGEGRTVRLDRQLGDFADRSVRFFKRLASAQSAVMHTRFGTGGDVRDVQNAHPFPVRVGNRTVLYGAHNGVLDGTRATATAAGRPHTVDSRELFELLARRDVPAIQGLSGYGMLTWIRAGAEKCPVRMARLSDMSDIAVTRLSNGGVVWSSTRSDLDKALAWARLDRPGNVDVTPQGIGRVYTVTPQGLFPAGKTGLTVQAHWYDWRMGDAFDWGDAPPKADTGSSMSDAVISDPTPEDWARWEREYTNGYGRFGRSGRSGKKGR